MKLIETDNYFASEIKKPAIKCSKYNHPNIIHLGDVRNIHYTNLGIEVDKNHSSMRVLGYNIDLLIGGSPCKGISGMNQLQQGLEHPESVLFWEYVRILEEIRLVNPDVEFILENTHGKKEATDTITKVLGVEPLNINSRLVSAQNRPRYYWTNIKGVEQPDDLGITINDILETDFDEKYIVPENRIRWLESESGRKSVSRSYCKINPYPKAGCLTANGHSKWNENYIKLPDGRYRFFTQNELEALQTLPKGYTDSLTYNEASDCIGDGWTIKVISHILKQSKHSSFNKIQGKQVKNQLELWDY